MSSESESIPLSPEEQAQRHRLVRKSIFLRASFIGLLVAAWWIMFVPDSTMESGLKIILGIGAGLVAAGSYLFNLRETLASRPKISQLAE